MNLDTIADRHYRKEYTERFGQPDFDHFYCKECGVKCFDASLEEGGLCEGCLKNLNGGG